MGRVTVLEPHPTVVKNQYIQSGRGGAGNLFRAPITTPAAGIPTQTQASPPNSACFYFGRGGAGNAHAGPPQPSMSLDEEYDRQLQIEQKPVGHVGRGGAGNVFGSARKASDASSRRSSSSTNSDGSGFWRRLSKSVSRGH
jgi:hypothetical protein